MACQLYTEKDLSALYSVVRGEIMDKINDPSTGKFDQKAFDKLIRDIYKELSDNPTNAELYAQAIPDILMIVANDVTIKRYLRSPEVDLNFNYVQDLSLEFEDPENVKKFVLPKAVRKTKAQVDSEIKKKNKGAKAVIQKNDNDQPTPWSAVQEKALVDFPDKTSGNIAIAKNPETMTEEERNHVDKEKELFYEIIKTVVWASRRRGATDQVMLGDKSVMLRAQSIRSLDPADLTADDRNYLSRNKTYNLNVAIISDTDGNPIRFDEKGNIVEEGGRIVYQYIRPVINSNGKLYLGNRSGFLYSLIPATKLAEREIKQRSNDGELLGQVERDEILSRIKTEQTQKMNDLARLNEQLATSSEPVMLPITGGSYGIVERKSALLSQTPFADDLEMIYIHDSGALEGSSYFLVNRVKAGVAVDNRIYLQKMDMTEAIAKNIAKVLTTKALLNGEPLSPQIRQAYYDNFLSNRVKGNNFTVEIENVLGQNVLKVVITDPITKESAAVDLDSPGAEKMISDHLMASKKIADKNNPGSFITYPASMSYMKSFAVDGAIQKGVTFTDYDFATSKSGAEVIRETKKDYFEFIKPLAKVDFTVDPIGYFVGINAYMNFAIPMDLEVPSDELTEIGMPITDDVEKDEEPQKKTKVEVDEEEDEETGEKVKFQLEVWPSKLADAATISTSINEADGTFGIGVDFSTKDEKHAEAKAGQKNKWYGLKLGSKTGAPKNFTPSADAINQIVKNLIETGGPIMHIVGNDISVLEKQGYSQQDIDKYVYNILKEVVKQFPIKKIISNGQTGIAEASIKAAKRLGIPVKIRAFSGYRIRTSAPYLAIGYKSEKNTKADFVKRFFSKSTKTYKKANAKVSTEKIDKTTTAPKTIKVQGRVVEINGKTVEEQKAVDRKINRLAIDDLLDGSGMDLIPDMPFEADRSKRASALMNQLYGDRKSWDEVQKWWDNSPLKNIVDLERLALVFNSDAYGKFMSAGSLLADAAVKLRQKGLAARIELYGDALPVTLYHEAWHAFSQLVLTKDEKKTLYDEIRSYDKWATMEYIDIEEELAENFIDYAVTGKKQKGFIQKIFNKIKSIIDFFFGNTTKRDITRLEDIPNVKEYYNKLYTGNFTVSTENAENNLMPGFQRLNSAKKTIQPIVNIAKDFAEITDVQSDKIVNLMDTLMARSFYQYNSKFNTTSGAVRLLGNINNRQQLYVTIEKQLKALLDRQIDITRDIMLANAEPNNDNPDYDTEQKEVAKLDLLTKAVENYGVVTDSLAKKTDKGVVAFHMQRSRFSILKDSYIDDTEDASTALFKTTEGNSVSSKQLATDDTMMMLSGIYKFERDSDGDYLRRVNEEGVEAYVPMLDDFGLPVLEDVNTMWNRLARTLQGSLDYQEMHDRMAKAIDNYPEFMQVLEMLPNPYQMGPAAYNNTTEFQSETNFWQDLKKPVIPYIQLNINKTVVEKAKVVEGKRIPEKASYESRLAAANLDIYKIINAWTTNFNIADNSINPYIEKDADGTNYLLTGKIMKEFGRNGQLIPERAADFLKALGIQLDMTSAEIRNIVRDTTKPFSSRYNIDYIFNNIRLVHLAGKADDLGLNAAADLVKRQPLYYLMNDLPKAIVDAAGGKSRDVKTKIRTLAELQNRFSDGYSNYSVLSPEKNKVWEQFVDNTITRVITAVNLAKNWQELTSSESDPNGRFQHMRWLAEGNNTGSQFSVMLNSIFDLDQMSDTYGEKLPNAKIILENIGGTQIINKDTNESTGTSTASTDVTSKFLQEFHTMLQSGVQEFMRHASKQTAMNMRASKIDTYSGKDSDNLYVDIMAFSPANTVANNNFGESQGFNIMLGYLAAEAGRIFRYKSDRSKFQQFSGYNRKVVRADDDSIVDAGEAFTAFDDVLTPEVQADIYAIIDRAVEEKLDFEEFNLKEIINEDPELRQLVKNDVVEYFNTIAQQNYNRLEDARYVDQSLYDMVSSDELSKNQVDKMLIKAYTYNSWIHNYETVILAYGDLVQYNHDKEEFHKRNAGLGSGGRGFRADMRARAYINSPMFQRLYAEKEGYQMKAFDGTLTSAIIKETVIDKSVYKDEYYKKHVADYTARYIKAGKSKAEAKKLAEELANTILGEYEEMKIADGQGWVNFEAYRMLKNLEGSWGAKQEELYKKVVNKELITSSDIKEFFPPYKLQYYGNMQTTGLPLVSFHKFSLAPIIPSVHTSNTQLGQVHDMMLSQNVDYILMETGSKVGHIGSGDNVFDADGNINTATEFTKNVVFAEYLKNQTEVNNTYKGKSIFSTQLRKLILEGLYEQGVIDTTDESGITNTLVQNYIDRVGEYTELLKNELVDEIGFEENADGEYVPADKNSIAKLSEMIRANLTRDDVLSDKLIDIIDVTEEGELRFDLSLHPEANKIEKLLLSLVNKRIIKQKVKGEALVQKSSAFYDGLFELNNSEQAKFLKAEKNAAKKDAFIKKYMGSNFLPTYHEGENGKTTAMKVAIALQGDYENLLNLEYQGEPIDTIDRLNQAIKDDEWLDANDGENRKAITMVGVRIPVQGLNSMEFMEVYHFLDPSAGNIIIPPAEIVAKSGADFDIDKLSIFMTSLNGDGKVNKAMFEDAESFYRAIKNPSEYGMSKAKMYEAQKSGLENELINDMRRILELPQNYVSLTTPNGTYLVKPIADRLSEFVSDYIPSQNITKGEKLSAPDKNGKQKKVISPTRILEAGYNLYKHESNVVGKRTLGLGAIENTFNVLFNSLGATMPAVYKHSKEESERVSFLGLRHNRMQNRNGEDVISLSNQYDVDGINKVADIINQLMNGWVDVEKDAWIFFVQGNYEVSPILLYLLKTGVPVEEAVYFVSQPLVRDYVKEKRLAESTFAEPLRRDPGFQGVNFKAASNVIAKNFKTFIADNRARYETGRNMMENYFESNGRTSEEDKHFTSEEMLKLIQKSKTNPELAKSDLSKAMFLHYLTIEQQITGLTAFKMASNPDTSTLTDVGQAIQTEANIEALAEETKIDQDLRLRMLNDSVISSFFNTKLVRGLAKPLFKFRYDDDIQEYIQDYLGDFTNTAALKAVFGRAYRDKFPVVFRNDILSYLFQNALRKYSLGKEYSSYSVDEKIPVQMVPALKFGAYVAETETGPKMFVDRVQIEKEFYDKSYLEGSEAKNNYEDRGLYPLSPGHFGNNIPSNKDEYVRFVMEREYLRSLFPMSEVSKTIEFKNEFDNATKTRIKGGDTENRRFAYEKILASRALDNTLNPYHLFNDRESAYAIRLEKIKGQYRDGFVKDYPILARFVPDSNSTKTMFNLYVDDKDMDTFKSNMYSRNLEDLSNRQIVKVKDKAENNRISDFFAKITYVAMLQSGVNKSKYNFLGLTDFDKFIDIMNDETAQFLNAPNKTQLLVDFKNKFEQVNSQVNRERNRFKNYLTAVNVQKFESEAAELAGEGDITSDNLVERKNLIPTTNPNVLVYNDLSGTEKAYKYITENNQDVTFVYQFSLGQKQNFETMTDAEFNKKKLTGQVQLKKLANSSSIGMITGQNSVADGFSKTDAKYYKGIKTEIEKTINAINEVIQNGGKVAFSMNGYGDPALMPEELFVYLSRRLFEEFQYLNPGSEFAQEVSDEVAMYQTITDTEILAKFEGENNPLKC